MANEPERPIEILLRAAAQKRRGDAGPPFELHPANRRLLQGEVARKFAKPQRESRSFAEVLGQLWPRFAGGLAILALLGLAVWALLPVPRNDLTEGLLARNLPAAKDMLAKEPLPAATPAPAAVVPPLVPTAKEEPAMLAYADKTPSGPGNAARQLGAVPSPLAEGGAVVQLKRQDADKLVPAAAPGPVERLESPMPLPTTSRETFAQTPVADATGALERLNASAGQPPAAASLPTAPTAPLSVAMAPTTASAPLADEVARLAAVRSQQPAGAPVATAAGLAQQADDKSGQTGTYFRPSAEASLADRPNPSPLITYRLAKAAPELSQEARALRVAQRFVQFPPQAKAKDSLADGAAATHAVLASFQVEQSGQVLRIVDGDGSIYTGSVQLANAARRARSTNVNAPAASITARPPTRALEQEVASSLDSNGLTPHTYSFRVAGTNRSLLKKVVFTGNLLTPTNLILSLSGVTNLSVGGSLANADRRDSLSYSASNLNVGGSRGGSKNATAQPGFLPLLNSRISGKVVVGNGQAVELNALPASP